ncbi:hypothetical protein DQ04_01481050 [Trypanosoma grayi]|uniref:hypothetical protein n=1 Tax=Trypanosoma grayi TaxID=71804 RepID=UPI0004F42C05|nr:hypothetical protein DQ04_01481050 [Trypanosoma grayi]KEG12702.1 hypothetical protein DQ04_01481050 [Trypanosoma grayi]
MANRLPSRAVGQRPQRQYLNKATEFFFRELDKGLSSPCVVLSLGALFAVAGWKFLDYYVEPNRQQNAVWRRPQSRVPLSDSHNTFWGLGIGGDEWRGIPGGRHTAESMTEGAEEALRRPTLVDSEMSELPDGGGSDQSVVCMQLPEYDARLGDDVVYRSVHYVPGLALGSGRSGTSTAPVATKAKVEEGAEEEEETSPYLSRMPARGASIIHGMVKCKAITSLNNCVPYAGHLEGEYARKMMLALGPVHILRDIAQTSFPLRLTTAREAPVSALVCGLHSGEIPRWLSNAFPNFRVDVVERDGTLARVCRRFLGFQESGNLRLFIADPADFLRRTAVQDVGRRYDLIMVDAIDGAGRLSTQYGHLEFINSIRNSLTGAGCVIMSLPNRDGAFLYNVVQNWRIAFPGRTVILVHCVTSPHTMLMTFQDDAGRGKANFGTIANAEEFRDLLRTKLAHYGPRRVPFDLTREVSQDSFRILHPSTVYPIEAYLPVGHPELRDAAAAARGGSSSGGGGQLGGWSAWLRQWSSAWLTPSQRADLRRMER